MVDSEFNEPASGKGHRGPKPKGPLAVSNRRVRIELVWEGTELEARAFGRLQRHLITDLDGTPDRPLVLKLRQAWVIGCEKAEVANA